MRKIKLTKAGGYGGLPYPEHSVLSVVDEEASFIVQSGKAVYVDEATPVTPVSSLPPAGAKGAAPATDNIYHESEIEMRNRLRAHEPLPNRADVVAAEDRAKATADAQRVRDANPHAVNPDKARVDAHRASETMAEEAHNRNPAPKPPSHTTPIQAVPANRTQGEEVKLQAEVLKDQGKPKAGIDKPHTPTPAPTAKPHK